MGENNPRSVIKKKIEYWTEVRDKWKGEYDRLEKALIKAEEMGADKKGSKYYKLYQKRKGELDRASGFWQDAEDQLKGLTKA